MLEERPQSIDYGLTFDDVDLSDLIAMQEDRDGLAAAFGAALSSPAHE